MKTKYKTIILSDVHLGSPDSQSDKLIDFLETVEAENIILNGDLIDFRQLNTIGKWTDREDKVINYLINLTKTGVNIKYINGNHDKVIQNIININIPGVEIKKEMSYTTGNNKKYYVCHGDRFDFMNTHLTIIGKMANFVYGLIYIFENKIRKIFGIKNTMLFAQKLRILQHKLSFPKEKIIEFMKDMKYDGLIIGHYHLPSQVKYSNKEYLNSGDRIYHCTAIVETYEGTLQLIHYGK